jgi:hypothetical protein
MEARLEPWVFGRQFPLGGGPRSFGAVEILATRTDLVEGITHQQMCTSTEDVYKALWNCLREKRYPQDAQMEMARQLLAVRERAMTDDVSVMSALRNTLIMAETARAQQTARIRDQQHEVVLARNAAELTESNLRATHAQQTISVLTDEVATLKRMREGDQAIEHAEEEFEGLRRRLDASQRRETTLANQLVEAKQEITDMAKTGGGKGEDKLRKCYRATLGMLQHVASEVSDEKRGEAVWQYCDQFGAIGLPVSELMKAFKVLSGPSGSTPKPAP